MKKPPAGRSKILSLRLKPKEHELLVAEAEQMYLPLSAYLRHKLFGQQGAAVAGQSARRRKESR